MINKPKKWILILISVFFLFSTLLTFTIVWLFHTWPKLQIHEFLFEILTPLKGTGSDQIRKFIIWVIVPTSVVGILVAILYYLLTEEKRKMLRKGLVFLSIISLVLSGVRFWTKLDVTNYIRNQWTDSTFIQKEYVDPSTVALQFPKKKRNLIYISLESVETGFSSQEYGGKKKNNYIPELTKLALSNQCFSANQKVLNGAVSLTGTGWTMGGLFAQTSGLPLKVNMEGNSMISQETFFPNIMNLGDILAKQGYQNVFMLGSDAEFGGRQLFFKSHGNYEINDYNYAKQKNWIPSNYHVFWGFEDHKLFDFAKMKLTNLSSSDKPFNLHLLTVDTHFEDGYKDHETPTKFSQNQYGNVIYGSDKRVSDFVKWCQKQPWYENTTIVLSGDHPTMDKDFMEGVDMHHKRTVYYTIVNGIAKRENSSISRYYSTMDSFPTTLAALGVKIPGDRLALGTNLYGQKKTLVEEYGEDFLNEELAKKSSFMEKLAAVKKEENEHPYNLGFESSVQGKHLKLDWKYLLEKDQWLDTSGVSIFQKGQRLEKTTENSYALLDETSPLILKIKDKEVLRGEPHFFSQEFHSFIQALKGADRTKYDWYMLNSGDYMNQVNSERKKSLISLGLTEKELRLNHNVLFTSSGVKESSKESIHYKQNVVECLASLDANEKSWFVYKGKKHSISQGINFFVVNKETGEVTHRSFNTIVGYPSFDKKIIQVKNHQLQVELSQYSGVVGEVFGNFLIVSDGKERRLVYLDLANGVWKANIDIQGMDESKLEMMGFLNVKNQIYFIGDIEVQD
ncbi:LTA synthase family protein [Bulleidia sp. zg-1006]|uniref:LTA synthase family protein n=1 Tax=Bulleidia sp. zg-1006 TaxID=2806552 RepID=UPI001A915FA4|nr:LTA synthase family protein [Bulleidia sp. zg-1006]